MCSRGLTPSFNLGGSGLHRLPSAPSRVGPLLLQPRRCQRFSNTRTSSTAWPLALVPLLVMVMTLPSREIVRVPVMTTLPAFFRANSVLKASVDVAFQPRVSRSVHDSHAAGAELLADALMPERLAGHQRNAVHRRQQASLSDMSLAVLSVQDQPSPANVLPISRERRRHDCTDP